MRRMWLIVIALAGIALVTDARADTVYLENGQSIWGREAYEEGDSVVLVRPSGNLRIPKSQVKKIERTQSTLPPFYSSPQVPPTGGGPAMPSVPDVAGQPNAPAPPAAPGGAPPPPPPSGGATTQLPPAPPPPAPGR